MEKVKHRNFYILLFHFKEQRLIRRNDLISQYIFQCLSPLPLPLMYFPSAIKVLPECSISVQCRRVVI